jgi:hypothetical protein
MEAVREFTCGKQTNLINFKDGMIISIIEMMCIYLDRHVEERINNEKIF